MSKRRDKLNLYLFDLLMAFLTYSMFFKRHFSVDSYCVYYNMDANNQLRATRFINYVFIKFFERIGFNTCKEQWILTGIFIAVSAFSVWFLTGIFKKYITDLTFKKLIALNLAILMTVMNVYILEWYLFPEIMLFYAISLLFAVLAVGIIDSERKFYVKYFLATVFLFISLNCYQVSMPIYVIYGITLFLIRNKFSLTKKAFLESCGVLFSAGLASMLILVEQKIIVNVRADIPTDRNAEFGLETILHNIKNIIGNLRLVLEGYGFLPRYFVSLFLVSIFIIMIYAFVKSKSTSIQYLYLLLVLLVNVSIVFAPHILAKEIWLAPRTIVAIGAVFSTLVIIVLLKLELLRQPKLYEILNIISVLFLLVNFVQIQDVGKNHYINNAIDNEYAVLIQGEINKYEEETGNEIKCIAAVKDENPQWNYRGVRYTIFDTNIKIFNVSWGFSYAISYYSNGRYYSATDMNEEIYNENFKGKDWDKYKPEEQLVFDKDTLYMVVY